MDCRPNAWVRSASADVGHRCVDLIVRWIWSLPQERHRRHDLPGLAIAALGNVEVLPCELDGMPPIGGQTFDGRDFRANGGPDRERAGARWLAVDVNGTGAAVSNAAGELVRPMVSRRTHRSGVSGSTSTKCCVPLTFTMSAMFRLPMRTSFVNAICVSRLPVERAGEYYRR